VDPEPVRIAVKESPWNLGEQSGAIARQIGGSCSAMRHSGGSLYRHGDDFMTASAIRGGYEADAARIVLAGGIERCCRGCRGVSSVMLAGTGRVDPLPIGGHGIS
jgi:hypothetical protein